MTNSRISFPAVLACLLLMCASMVSAQTASPVKWTEHVKMTSPTDGQLILSATIADGWHLFGITPVDGGPNPTVIRIDPAEGLTLEGQVTPTHAATDHVDMVFHLRIPCWKSEISFVQNFKINEGWSGDITGSISYQAGNDQTCIPPTRSQFSVDIAPAANHDTEPQITPDTVNLPMMVKAPVESRETDLNMGDISLTSIITYRSAMWSYLAWIVIAAALIVYLCLRAKWSWAARWWPAFVALCFVELAVTIRIVSVIAAVKSCAWFHPEMLGAAWGAIFLALSAYLAGIIKPRHDDPDRRPGWIRLFAAVCALAIAIYVLPATWSEPSKGVERYFPHPNPKIEQPADSIVDPLTDNPKI